MIYRLGMIGLWDHTSYALDPLPNYKNVQLVACAGATDSQIANHRKRYPFFNDSVKIYSDFHEMLKNEGLDIVVVHTTHSERTEALIAAAQAGAHIFSEKPLCTSLLDLPLIRQNIAQAKVKLTMMLAMRFEGIYRRMYELIHQGAIGEVVLGTAQKSYKLGERAPWMRNRGTYAGTIPYIGCHALDLIRWTTGLEFVRGAAFHANVGHPELGGMENSASMILTANNGATLSARLDYCRPENANSWGDDRLRIAGLEGVVEIMNGEVTLMTGKNLYHEVPPLEDLTQFDNFMNAIEGREDLLVSENDCYRITEIVLKLRDAADNGVVVSM